MNLNLLTDSTSKMTFSVRSLMFATFLVAWVLAVNNGLRTPYGWLTAIPLAYSAPLLLLNLRVIFGGVVGSLLFAFSGELLNQFDYGDIRHWLVVIVFAAYGFACGAGVHAILQKKYLFGAIVFLASVATLAYCMFLPISA